MNVRQHPREWLLHILEIHFHNYVDCFTFQCHYSASLANLLVTYHMKVSERHQPTPIMSIGKVASASRVCCWLFHNWKVYHYS